VVAGFECLDQKFNNPIEMKMIALLATISTFLAGSPSQALDAIICRAEFLNAFVIEELIPLQNRIIVQA